MSAAMPLAVVGFGMFTAVGNDGISTCAALRAGISGAAQVNLWDYTGGTHLAAARVTAHQWWEGATMVPELIVPPVLECLRRAEKLMPGGANRVPILILLPPPSRPYRDPNLDQIVLDGVSRKLDRPLPPGSTVIAEGRTGFLRALEIAELQFERHSVQIVASVESFMRQVLVAHYIEDRRLLCQANSNGFVPGEAASAVLLAQAGRFPSPELQITGVGEGREASGTGGNALTPVTGDGLTNAIRDALTQAGCHFYDINVQLADLNGERFKFKEAAIAATRLDRVPPSGKTHRPRGYMEHWNAIESLGEIGTAFVPAALGWAFDAGCRSYLPGPLALIHAGEDDGTRLALIAAFHRRERNP